DVAFADFPDPHNFSLGKLYTSRFYGLVRDHLDAAGALAVQSTSPLMARRADRCHQPPPEGAGLPLRPPPPPGAPRRGGGYALGARRPFEAPTQVMDGLRYLDARTLGSMFVLGPDMSELPADINRLNNQALVRYYEDEWRHWN